MDRSGIVRQINRLTKNVASDSGRRGAVLNRGQGGMFHKRSRRIAGRGSPDYGDGQPGKRVRRERCGCGRDRVRARTTLLFANPVYAAIEYSRTEDGDRQVVGDRDGRPQDDESQRESDKLHTPAVALLRRMPQPHPNHPQGQRQPGQIECPLHCCYPRFYNVGS